MSMLRKLRRKQSSEMYGVSGRNYNRMTHEHVDVLQNIEFVLVSAYRDRPELDDRVMAAALQIAIAGGEAADEQTDGVVQALADIREIRPDVSEDLWENGLKVVLRSVHNHSGLQPGDTGYLDFVSSFM